jgi:hypothetical protein
MKDPPPPERYLFGAEGRGDHDYEGVLLFSGGLDSLAGAVREVLQERRKVALVSHRPVSKVYHRQCDLVAALDERLPERRVRPLHVAVEVNKGKRLGRDHNQRGRSFLFAAVGAVVARLFGLPRLRFYENGVTSLNLPISPQVLGGRASRTTHPQTLTRFTRLFTALFGEDFLVENPFLWETKANLLASVKAAGHGALCAQTSSCTHTWEATSDQPHCGRCPQCVDRRLTALAAGLDDREDPPGLYRSDVLMAPREGAELTLIERYVGTARRVEGITDPLAFARSYGEVARALRYAGLPPAAAAERVCGLYRHHAGQVLRALERVVGRAAPDLVRMRCPPNCLASIALGRAAQGPLPGPGARAVPGGPAGRNGAAAAGGAGVEFDDDLFEARVNGKACPLGNTREYALLKRLARRPGTFVSVNDLRRDVWGDEETEKNTVQRTVSNLRRKLRDAGITGAEIDGKQPGSYRLVLQK